MAVLCALALAAPLAHADDRVQRRRMSFHESGRSLLVTASFSELFDARAYERLASGFPTTVIIQAQVTPAGGDLPVAYTLGSYRVVYDLWDEMYTVRIDGPNGSSTVRLSSRAEVLETIGRVVRFPVADLGRIAVGPHYELAVIVELNPVSEQLLAETRRWLSKPAGQGRLDISSSMFGSFVSVFVNPKLAEADRVLRLRSQPFYRVPR